MRYYFIISFIFLFLVNIFAQKNPFHTLNLYGNETKAYSKDLSIFCAKISQLIYSDKEKNLIPYCKKHKFSVIKYQKKIENSLLDLQYLVAHRAIDIKKEPYNLILIAFRGTEEKMDWLTDAMIIPHKLDNDLAVHTGFWKYTESFKKDEENIILENLANRKSLSLKELIENPQKTIFLITGHSLGGAVATLYSVSLCDRKIMPQVYTFGAPGVGNKAFVEKYKNQFTLHRIVNQYDIVPESTLLDYALCNTININNSPKIEFLAESLAKVAFFYIKEQEKIKKYMFFHIGIKHSYGRLSEKELNKNILLDLHSMDTYVKNLSK